MAASFDDPSLFEYEEEVRRDPFSVIGWLQYLDKISSSTSSLRFELYERAISRIPRSYKLWLLYLDEYHRYIRGKCITDEGYGKLDTLYERALIHLNKMPRIWLKYGHHLEFQCKLSNCRRMYDRALQHLPITQHDRIWSEYLKFVKKMDLKITLYKVYRRYLMFDPNGRGDYIAYLISKSYLDQATREISTELNTTDKPNHALWMKLCDLISQSPEQVAPELNIEAILRSGIRQFTDQVGRLWCALATYWIRLGDFETARDVYEEGMRKVVLVRDFSMLFEAYSKFQEELVMADEEQMDMRLSRLEYLIDRRPLLLSSVMLRQNAQNVREWLKRIELFKTPTEILKTYTEAVKTVKPFKAVGKCALLWIQFAKYYETLEKDITNARLIFQKAININYKSVDEFAMILCEWAEMEIRHEYFDEALSLLRNATQPPERAQLLKKGRKPVQDRVYQSVRLWSCYLDLEESLGTIDSTRKAYDCVIGLKIATAQMMLNYANFLKEQRYFEDSFKVYERALTLFGYPQAFDIWKTYLKAFDERYQGKKLERSRELYQQAIQSSPDEHLVYFYTQYALLEEKHGRIRNAMQIYEDGTNRVEGADQLTLFVLYIQKVQEYFGVAKTRPVYEKAIEKCNDKQVPTICLQFAIMEQKLGEIDRARALYAHSSQFCDPKMEQEFWQKWHDFEVSFGNENTFLDMLRIKRAVEAQYAQVNYMATDTAAPEMVKATNAMTVLEETTEENQPTNGSTEAVGINKRKEPPVQEDSEKKVVFNKKKSKPNPEEIDLDDDDLEIEEQPVPATVFGALERLQQQQQPQ